MKIWGFLKARNEILREGNIHRVLKAFDDLDCEGGIVCDDASSDETDRVLREFVVSHAGAWALMNVPPSEQRFECEMSVKQQMMSLLHTMAQGHGAPDYVLWLDGDETIADCAKLRAELEALPKDVSGVLMHYTQLWRTPDWARTDGGFDGGWFCKIWRYRPDLGFDISLGTHHAQFPKQMDFSRCARSAVDIIHWGNYGKNLVYKAIQYAGGLGGVDRHIAFGHSQAESMATGEGFDQKRWSEPNPTYRYLGSQIAEASAEKPKTFSLDEIRRIRAMGNHKREKETFAVIVPAYNRAQTLPRALDSLIAQRYERWIAFVLDDGSTDDTPAVMREYQDRDPRIFYARYEQNRGGVAMNEIGMALAIETAEWWSRLGSDDFFGPNKLALDAEALREHEACYGLFTVMRDGAFAEICNPPMKPEDIRTCLLSGDFKVSWANIAARCSTLERVRERFGRFCEPDLRNCEDFLLNARLAATGTDFHFRGPEGLPVSERNKPWIWPMGVTHELEAIWTCASAGGASSPENAKILGDDLRRTVQLIREMT